MTTIAAIRWLALAGLLLPTPALADNASLAAYLKARVADADGRSDVAAAGYARALAGAPANAAVATRAYREALAVGDDRLAAKAGGVLRTAGIAPPDLPLLALSQAAAANDPAAAEAAVVELDKTALGVLAPALRGWIAVARGADPAPALDAAGAQRDPIAGRFAAEARALLRIARGDTIPGVEQVTALQAAGAPIDLRLAAAQLLFGTGHPDQARALLTGDDPVLVAMRMGAPARPTLAFGVSRILARVAGDLAGNGPSALSIALTRAAVRADPADDRAQLLLADALSRDGSTDRALAVLDAVKPDSAFAAAAAAARVTVLANAGRGDEALAAAGARAMRADAAPGDWQRYADRLTAAGRPAEAAPFYARLLKTDGDRWTAWLQYGGALDQAGDWQAARPALEKAVALAPAEPLALNYLGYAQAERGENVAAAARMLERASALKPGDLSITDSLGWAYHLTGDTARALPLIQRAAEGEPDNAEIGEHLGDVYWTVGRRYEARYAWRAALLVADADEARRIAGKLANGLTNGLARAPARRR